MVKKNKLLIYKKFVLLYEDEFVKRVAQKEIFNELAVHKNK